jgi:hypothetical protein
MAAEKDNALRRINGKQREPASPCNNIEERESCPKGKGKPAMARPSLDRFVSAGGFSIDYDGKPCQDDRPVGPALQVLRVQS